MFFWLFITGVDNICSSLNLKSHGFSVFEIKGAPGARRAHFRRRVHVFVSCAPGVCMFFQ